MPQLVKGGKYVFGWVIIQNNRSINIPNEAYSEYGFMPNENGILMKGSKRSGGFAISSERLLKNTAIGNILFNNSKSIFGNKNSSDIIKIKERIFWRVKINTIIFLSDQIMQFFRLNHGDKLLAVRGSGLALGFITNGPIYIEAEKHPKLACF